MTVADGVVGGGIEVAAGVVTENQSSHAHTTMDDCSSMPRPSRSRRSLLLSVARDGVRRPLRGA